MLKAAFRDVCLRRELAVEPASYETAFAMSIGNRNPERFTKSTATDRSFEDRNRALRAVAIMRREGKSITAAATEAETTPKTILKYVPAALRKKERQWTVTEDDRYIRYLQIPGESELITIRVQGYKEAQFVSAYISSLKRWLRGGKAYELASFHGKKVGLEQVELITASRTLRKMADYGLLRLETLYAALKDIS